MKKTGKILIGTAVALILGTGCILGIQSYDRNILVSVDGVQYRNGRKPLDLRDQEISAEHFLHLREVFPDREILWNVPFQKRHYESTVEKIKVTSLTEEDADRLMLFPNLKQVNAENCFDYEALKRLRENLPRCQVTSYVEINDEILPWNTERLEFYRGEGDYEELMQRLAFFPNLKEVYFREPELQPRQLLKLQETYPKIAFSWDKRLFGKRLRHNTESLDLSGMQFESVEQVERQIAYLPGLKKLTICGTDLPYEDLAAFRERNREKFQVIFNVVIKTLSVRTDSIRFVPSEQGVIVSDCDTRYLKYCEDLRYVDLSQNVVRNIEWVQGTPHLQYLIFKDSPLRDLQPLRNLKELKVLKLQKLDLRDMRPLLSCTALEDLSITGIFPQLEVLSEMKWLKNLWTTGGKEYLQTELPHTKVHADYESGWEDLQNVKDMKAMKDPHTPEITAPLKKEIVPGFYIPRM